MSLTSSVNSGSYADSKAYPMTTSLPVDPFLTHGTTHSSSEADCQKSSLFLDSERSLSPDSDEYFSANSDNQDCNDDIIDSGCQDLNYSTTTSTSASDSITISSSMSLSKSFVLTHKISTLHTHHSTDQELQITCQVNLSSVNKKQESSSSWPQPPDLTNRSKKKCHDRFVYVYWIRIIALYIISICQ